MKQLLLLIGIIFSAGLAPGFAAETTPAAATAESPKTSPKPAAPAATAAATQILVFTSLG